MGIKMTTPMAEIERQIEEQMEQYKEYIVKMLHKVGEEAVNEARNSGTYKDQTGNLRSSIGYVIVVDGIVYYGKGVSFTIVKDGKQGSEDGKAYAKKIAEQYPTGITLIVVAGMQYASYVQAMGYDVTVSAEHLADSLLSLLGAPKLKRVDS